MTRAGIILPLSIKMDPTRIERSALKNDEKTSEKAFQRGVEADFGMTRVLAEGLCEIFCLRFRFT